MAVLFYHIFLPVYNLCIQIASIGNAKAKKWVQGRKNIFATLEAIPFLSEKIIWMHCASLGEYEQGRPVLEELKQQYPDCKILLTFFSPSGYEIQKKNKGAHHTFYLPLDGVSNAKRFLKIIKPHLVIFVKYEYWFFYLKEIRKLKIPLILISAAYHKHMIFFKWYGSFYRKMLGFYSHIFVQNKASHQLLEPLKLASKVTTAGDTRFDRVFENSRQSFGNINIEAFIQNKICMVAGSTWAADDEVLSQMMKRAENKIEKLIIAPHEITEPHLTHIKTLFPTCAFLSKYNSARDDNKQVLIIDSIGLLSKIYRYAHFAYIGGGFGKGIHNILEAAVFGKPIFFGPKYKKFYEAVEIIQLQAAYCLQNEKEIVEKTQTLLANTALYTKAQNALIEYVTDKTGATQIILNYIYENRLLTN